MRYGTVGEWSDISFEGAGRAEFDSGRAVVVESGFMDGEIEAVGGSDGEWGMDGVTEAMNKSGLIIIFVAVWLVGGDFPGNGVGVDIKLGEFVFDGDLTEFGLRWDFIAEADGIVKNTKSQGEDALGVFGFGEVESCFGVVVSDEAIFAPGELDGLGMFGFVLAD